MIDVKLIQIRPLHQSHFHETVEGRSKRCRPNFTIDSPSFFFTPWRCRRLFARPRVGVSEMGVGGQDLLFLHSPFFHIPLPSSPLRHASTLLFVYGRLWCEKGENPTTSLSVLLSNRGHNDRSTGWMDLLSIYSSMPLFTKTASLRLGSLCGRYCIPVRRFSGLPRSWVDSTLFLRIHLF